MGKTESKIIKGQAFVRKFPDVNKAVIVAVVDADAIPSLESEHQHVIVGSELAPGRVMIQTTGEKMDIKDKAAGLTVDGLLTSPIWRT